MELQDSGFRGRIWDYV